ncbi:MAG: hypothetical protein GY822_27015 [Deltaproteobacteria bacterium]|nr:hypothetical protein [Deltaproteobacteria bacterium]
MLNELRIFQIKKKSALPPSVDPLNNALVTAFKNNWIGWVRGIEMFNEVVEFVPLYCLRWVPDGTVKGDVREVEVLKF